MPYGEVDPDFAAELNQKNLDFLVKRIQDKSKIDPGKPGECEMCELQSPRLIKSVCPRCRDKHKLP